MANKSGALMGRYELGRLLGQGTFAKVYFARSVITGQGVAIKVIDKERVFRVNMMEQIKREVSVLRMVRHPNIVHLYEVMATKTKIYFVMEYAKGGELFDKLVKGRLKEDVARKYFQQLIGAVEFCHSRGVYHRDLKPENMLLDENDNLKVSDFGLSALAESKHQDGLLHTRCGTPAYVAPEVIKKGGYDGAKSDIWSCGVILFVFLAGYLPFHDSNLLALYRKIGEAEYRCPSWISKDAKRLLQRILEPDPNIRITVAKIKESSWYRNAKALKSGSSSKAIAPPPVDSESTAGPSGNSSSNSTAETEPSQEQVQVQPIELNAFDIISLSCGFDLSGLFEVCGPRKETRFTSKESASVIISRLIETAKCLRLKVSRMDKGLLNFEATEEGKKGQMSIDAEIFEVTPSLFMVEMRKCRGDTTEYLKMLKEDLRPALQDIVWAWQGEHKQKSLGQLLPQGEQWRPPRLLPPQKEKRS